MNWSCRNGLKSNQIKHEHSIFIWISLYSIFIWISLYRHTQRLIKTIWRKCVSHNKHRQFGAFGRGNGVMLYCKERKKRNSSGMSVTVNKGGLGFHQKIIWQWQLSQTWIQLKCRQKALTSNYIITWNYSRFLFAGEVFRSKYKRYAYKWLELCCEIFSSWQVVLKSQKLTDLVWGHMALCCVQR